MVVEGKYLTCVLELGPFNREVVRTLRIRNNNYDPVAFKVRYSPNSVRFSLMSEGLVRSKQPLLSSECPPPFSCL